jgi:hypothetical protein
VITGRIFWITLAAFSALLSWQFAANDNAAIDAAQKLIDGHDIELGNKDRRIAKFDRHPSNSKLNNPQDNG